MGSEVLLSGGHNIGGLSGDNSAIGVSDKSSVGESSSGVGESSIGVGESSGVSHGGHHRVDGATGSSEGSLGGLDLQGVSGDHSTIGVTHQLGGGGSDTGSENLQAKLVWYISTFISFMKMIIYIRQICF